MMALMLNESPLLAHPGHDHAPILLETDADDTVQALIPSHLDRQGVGGVFPAIVGVGVLAFLAVLGLTMRRRLAELVLAALAVVPVCSLACAGNEKGGDEPVTPPPPMQKHFEPFQKRLQFRWDRDYFYVGSNGLPDHNMMIGIKSWQQQVPLPQPYTGANAWRIPLRPVLADRPISAKKALFRGAIALAVNGVPIFNALNNRGEDAYLAGELDEWGGHCGRGDDYHYHIAPLHLEKVVGRGNPIAYALDGFPRIGDIAYSIRENWGHRLFYSAE